jgi:hypothetical protein
MQALEATERLDPLASREVDDPRPLLRPHAGEKVGSRTEEIAVDDEETRAIAVVLAQALPDVAESLA